MLSNAIVAAKRGDSDALRYLYVRNADAVYGYARTLLGDDAAAEAATGAIFGDLKRAIAGYTTGDFTEWLLDGVRSIADSSESPDEQLPQRVSGAEEESPLRAAAFDRLRPEQRRELVLYELIGVPPSDVALRIDMDGAAIASLRSQEHATLRDALATLRAAAATG